MTDVLELLPAGEFRHTVTSGSAQLVSEIGQREWEGAPSPSKSVTMISFLGYTTMLPGMKGHGAWGLQSRDAVVVFA